MTKMETEKEYVGMELCFFCQKPKGILLNTRLKKTLPREATYNKEPCDECKKYMEQGIIVISAQRGSEPDNPYRTGGWWVIKEEAVKNFISDKILLDNVLQKRVMFIEDEVADRIGLKKVKK